VQLEGKNTTNTTTYIDRTITIEKNELGAAVLGGIIAGTIVGVSVGLLGQWIGRKQEPVLKQIPPPEDIR
jgi:hypothetical protein